jgi:hypothetical protein
VKADSRLLAHGAVHPIRPDQVTGADPFAALDGGGDTGTVLVETGQPVRAQHPTTQLLQPLQRHRLGDPAISNWRTTAADLDLFVDVVRELGARS